MQQRNREARWHTDEWWMRLSEGRFSAEEARAWQAHLQVCAACREEWEAWREMERRLAQAPLPQPPAGFVEATVARWQAYRRRRRGLTLAALIAALPLATLGYGLLVGNPLLYLIELLQRLKATGSLLLPMLAQALVTWSIAISAALPWILAAMVIATLAMILNGSLLAGSMVLIRRRFPRR